MAFTAAMHHSAPAPSEARRTSRLVLVGLAGVLVAIIGTIASQSGSSSAFSFSQPQAPEAPRGVLRSAPTLATSFGEPRAPEAPRVAPPTAPSSAISFGEIAPRRQGRTPTDGNGAITEDDGVLPDGVTVFDDEFRGLANLKPDLVAALRDASTDAADDGIELYVNSGWRSTAYQNQLLREAVNKYGSKEEAARWVATADTSAHVSGEAVDIGGFDATAWLSEHGAAYGLCQIYRNEPWHYELRPAAIERGCPALYADSADDPGLQR